MNIRYYSAFVLLLCSCAQAQQARTVGSNTERRLATVADAVEMTKTGDDDYLQDWTKSGNVALFSPDGSKFVFVTQKGDLKRNVVSYSIWLFNTSRALASPKHELVATFESSSNRPAISQLKWLPNNDTLVFLGERQGETPQIYKIKSSDKKLERLTDQSTPITKFSLSDDGDALIYLAEENKDDPVFSDEERRRGFFVPPRHQWSELYLNRREWDARHEVYLKTLSMSSSEKIGVIQGFDWDAYVAISPNGEYALLRGFNPSPPAAWESYAITSVGDLVSRASCLEGEIAQCPEQYFLVDMKKRTLRPLLDAPMIWQNAGGSLAAWTLDSDVLVINALLPLASATAAEQVQREHNFYVAEIEIPRGAFHVIDEQRSFLPVFSMDLEKPSGRLIGRPLTPGYGDPVEFREHDGTWKITELNESAAKPSLPLSVTLDEDINSPPKLVATEPTTKQKTILLDLNPDFEKLTFGHVEVIHWQNREGLPAAGELYYPTGFVAGKHYPLVIQTHGESRERFWIDGVFTTANAAQALANQGFFVLQMAFGDDLDKATLKKLGEFEGTPKEGPEFASFVESAIDELDRRGLIDRARVGITGFSRTVFEGEYVLTHSSYPFAAAVMADGVDFGYANCIYYAYLTTSCEKMNEGIPWGTSLANWAKDSPPMRLDKIHTPILLQSITSPLVEWEVYAGLEWLKKPVDLINFFPEGTHQLFRPQQKYFSEQSAVDWYRFWLKSEEDPAPTKAEQYKRWRELKKLQSESEKNLNNGQTQH